MSVVQISLRVLGEFQFTSRLVEALAVGIFRPYVIQGYALDLTDGVKQLRGRLVKDRATSKPKLNCRNWECGVVIPLAPLPTGSNQALPEGEHPRMLDILHGHIPVPIELPGVAYGSGGTQRPWFFNEEQR